MQIQANMESLAACLASLTPAESGLGVRLSHETSLEKVLNNTTEAYAHLERYDLAVGRVFIHPSNLEDLRASGRVTGEEGSFQLWGADVVTSDEVSANSAVLVVEDGEVDPTSLTPPTYGRC